MLLLGCLDASDFEDEPSREDARRIAQSVTATKDSRPVIPSDKEKLDVKDDGKRPETTETTETTLVGHEAEKDAIKEDVVVPPSEPVTPPIDEVRSDLYRPDHRLPA